jgi:hypothetical protein
MYNFMWQFGCQCAMQIIAPVKHFEYGESADSVSKHDANNFTVNSA